MYNAINKGICSQSDGLKRLLPKLDAGRIRPGFQSARPLSYFLYWQGLTLAGASRARSENAQVGPSGDEVPVLLGAVQASSACAAAAAAGLGVTATGPGSFSVS